MIPDFTPLNIPNPLVFRGSLLNKQALVGLDGVAIVTRRPLFADKRTLDLGKIGDEPTRLLQQTLVSSLVENQLDKLTQQVVNSCREAEVYRSHLETACRYVQHLQGLDQERTGNLYDRIMRQVLAVSFFRNYRQEHDGILRKQAADAFGIPPELTLQEIRKDALKFLIEPQGIPQFQSLDAQHNGLLTSFIQENTPHIQAGITAHFKTLKEGAQIEAYYREKRDLFPSSELKIALLNSSHSCRDHLVKELLPLAGQEIAPFEAAVSQMVRRLGIEENSREGVTFKTHLTTAVGKAYFQHEMVYLQYQQAKTPEEREAIAETHPHLPDLATRRDGDIETRLAHIHLFLGREIIAASEFCKAPNSSLRPITAKIAAAGTGDVPADVFIRVSLSGEIRSAFDSLFNDYIDPAIDSSRSLALSLLEEGMSYVREFFPSRQRA